MINQPPRTGDQALDRFLNEIYEFSAYIDTKSMPENGWSLSDFTAEVSEIIGDKRDLIDIVEQYSDVETYTESIDEQRAYLDGIAAELRRVAEHSTYFRNIMEWWDQNYKLIENAQDAIELVGKSAYEVAVKNGFEGTETQWLASLKGAKGNPGSKGDQGDQGKDAFQVALDAGFVGTREEWLESLSGPQGPAGGGGIGGSSIIPNTTDNVGTNKQVWAQNATLVVDSELPTGRAYVSNPGQQFFAAPVGWFSVDPDLEYSVSMWVKADLPNSRVYLELRDQSGNHAVLSNNPQGFGGYLLSNYTMPTEWTKLESKNMRFKPDVSRVRVGGVYLNHSNGTERGAVQMFTDIQLAPVPKHSHVSADISDSINVPALDSGREHKLVRTGADGMLYTTSDPTSPNHLARKGYVDAQIAGHKHRSADITDAHHFTGGTMVDRVVKTWTDAHIHSASDPVTPNHLARKAYVDAEVKKKSDTDHKHLRADITDLPDVRSANAPDSIAQRTPSGNLEVAAVPTGPTSAASKSYVDSAVSPLAAKTELATKADLVGGVVPTSQIPAVALTKPFQVASRAEMLALNAQEGDLAVITAGSDKGTYMLGDGPKGTFASWIQLSVPSTGGVLSVNGQNGTVVLAAADVGAAPTAHKHPVGDLTASGTPGATTYLRGDGSWTVPPNTTYALPTQAEAEAGTATTARTWSAQRVSQAIAAKAAPVTHQHTALQISDSTDVGRNVLTASTQTAARNAIGAGTSSLAIGTTAQTAKAGNWAPGLHEVIGLQASLNTKVTGVGLSKIEVVTAMPATPDPNTLYIVK